MEGFGPATRAAGIKFTPSRFVALVGADMAPQTDLASGPPLVQLITKLMLLLRWPLTMIVNVKSPAVPAKSEGMTTLI